MLKNAQVLEKALFHKEAQKYKKTRKPNKFVITENNRSTRLHEYLKKLGITKKNNRITKMHKVPKSPKA